MVSQLLFHEKGKYSFMKFDLFVILHLLLPGKRKTCWRFCAHENLH